MKLEQFRTMWGNIDLSDGPLANAPYHDIEELIPELAKLGYNGIEMPFKQALHIGAERVRALLNEHNMKMTCMIFTDNVVVPGAGILWGGPYPGFTAPTSGEEMAECLKERFEKLTAEHVEYEEAEKTLTPLQEKVVETHLKVFKEQVEQAYKLFGDRDKDPTGVLTMVVSHSLKDNFSEQMALKFFRPALAWEAEQGFVVGHETHRKRFLHSPWVTRDFLLKYPDIRKSIKLTADLSHWINVAETDCTDPVLNQAIEFIVPNVYHTHCRVGYDHGPQVSDPRAPEWIPYTEGHERWWDWIWRSQLERGFTRTTMISEHGPPSYQQTIPHSKVPTAHIWDVNHWIHLRRQKRFSDLCGEAHENSKLVASETQGYQPETKILDKPDNITAAFASSDGKRQRIG
eukprot:CAMPEP_0177490638 /NCGR_PEP_ID=MMETSP0369-20130122/31368_1 /TAXON_ID=447022 ORGANISM="Scrippsiella hangoei-like, Strain SHHI-4" /NCGR_SAMPLE_ID=MMETSP0369 /ASSEMBLY_ACC=CAM_ASM_000364 /LENGTH=401 /DNA_ID=CAMNT_0018967231 /DNA_START=44 /DNA_END=1249 /DNA_ORIENTATION=+